MLGRSHHFLGITSIFLGVIARGGWKTGRRVPYAQVMTESMYHYSTGTIQHNAESNPIKYKSEFLQEQRKHSKENYGPDCTVSNTKFSSVTLNELAMKARERIL